MKTLRNRNIEQTYNNVIFNKLLLEFNKLQTDRQTDRKRDRQEERQADRKRDRQTGRETGRQDSGDKY